jgi:hypothetical protein
MPASTAPLTFSGHETFALRSNWLKKAYDILLDTPGLFYREDAFVLLGVGKNMAQSIRYWGRVSGVFERAPTGDAHLLTRLGQRLLADDGWDPFLVTPAARWLLHWQIAARPEAAFTWHFTFNLLKGGEFTPAQLAAQLRAYAAQHDERVPSPATITRDIECMLDCYCRPGAQRRMAAAEDLLLCPLTDLGLVQALPAQNVYRLVSGQHPDLPDALVAYAILAMLRALERRTLAFSDVAYAPRSPGRVFRLEEDALLARLHRLREMTGGRAYFTDQAGIRQVIWTDIDDPELPDTLLEQAFAAEVRYG